MTNGTEVIFPPMSLSISSLVRGFDVYPASFRVITLQRIVKEGVSLALGDAPLFNIDHREGGRRR